MEYVYAAMLLHKAKKAIDEAGIKKILEAAGVTPDETRVKALVAALDGVDLEKAINEAAIPVASASPVGAEASKEEKPKEEKKEEKAEQAAAGLGALFGIIF